MYRGRNRDVIERLRKVPKSEPKSNFWQNAALVFMGAVISFFSTIVNGIFSNRGEAKRIAIEQKVLFEKELVNTTTLNLAAVSRVVQWKFDSGLFDTTGTHAVLIGYEAGIRSWQLREFSTMLMMGSYVDSGIYLRYENLNQNLMVLGDSVARYLEVVENPDLHSGLFMEKFRGLEGEYQDFMQDFHAAILK